MTALKTAAAKLKISTRASSLGDIVIGGSFGILMLCRNRMPP
jgi:hypothetical protein